MAEISNNLIATLLIAAIVVSASGVYILSNLGPVTISGRALEYGTANVSVTGEVAIDMQRNVTDFGSSTLGGSARTITTQLDNYGSFDDGGEGNGTDRQGTCDGSESECAFPFVVENIGNTGAKINISSASAASSWIYTGATSYFKIKGNESANEACSNASTPFGETSWITLGTGETEACANLGSDTGNDTMRIHFNLTIPSATDTTSKGVVITIGATAAA